MNFRRAVISSDRSRRFRASAGEKPRSMKTSPLPLVITLDVIQARHFRLYKIGYIPKQPQAGQVGEPDGSLRRVSTRREIRPSLAGLAIVAVLTRCPPATSTTVRRRGRSRGVSGPFFAQPAKPSSPPCLGCLRPDEILEIQPVHVRDDLRVSAGRRRQPGWGNNFRSFAIRMPIEVSFDQLKGRCE